MDKAEVAKLEADLEAAKQALEADLQALKAGDDAAGTVEPAPATPALPERDDEFVGRVYQEHGRRGAETGL